MLLDIVTDVVLVLFRKEDMILDENKTTTNTHTLSPSLCVCLVPPLCSLSQSRRVSVFFAV